MKDTTTTYSPPKLRPADLIAIRVSTLHDTFSHVVFNAIFDAVINHGVIADKPTVQSYTNYAWDSFSREVSP